tara:strand:+ start:51 stop:260 length:210 start_codon:yes stop_codon:yes gene_type:complete
MTKDKCWNIIEHHTDSLCDKLIKSMREDIDDPKDNFGDEDFFTKMSEKELKVYVEDQILADGFLTADEK